MLSFGIGLMVGAFVGAVALGLASANRKASAVDAAPELAELRSRVTDAERRNGMLASQNTDLEDAVARANARVELAEAAKFKDGESRAELVRSLEERHRAELGAVKQKADKAGAKLEDMYGTLKELLASEGQL